MDVNLAIWLLRSVFLARPTWSEYLGGLIEPLTVTSPSKGEVDHFPPGSTPSPSPDLRLQASRRQLPPLARASAPPATPPPKPGGGLLPASVDPHVLLPSITPHPKASFDRACSSRQKLASRQCTLKPVVVAIAVHHPRTAASAPMCSFITKVILVPMDSVAI